MISNGGTITLASTSSGIASALTLNLPVNANNGSSTLGASPGLVQLIAESDITESTLDPYTVYSPAYEAMHLAQAQLQSPGANGLSAYNLIQLMEQMYDTWNTYQGALYGSPFIQRF